MIENLKSIIIDYYKRYKTFPTSTWLSEKLEINKGKLKEMLDKLCENKLLNKHQNKYYIPDIEFFVTKTKKQIKIKNILKNGISENIVRLIMFVVSCAAIYISIYYSNFWLSNFLSPFNSLVLASTMIIYATFAPQGAILLFSKGMYKAGFAIIFTGVIVILFSIISTVAGQYNVRLSDYQAEELKNNQVEINLTTLELLQSEEQSLIESIKRIYDEIKIHQEMMSQFSKEDTESIEYKIEMWKILEGEKSIQEKEKALTETRTEIKEFLKSDIIQLKVKENSDFYTWIGSIFNIDKKLIEFWLYMFPAIFVDIIAPFGMAIALSLSRGKRKKEKES